MTPELLPVQPHLQKVPFAPVMNFRHGFPSIVKSYHLGSPKLVSNKGEYDRLTKEWDASIAKYQAAAGNVQNQQNTWRSGTQPYQTTTFGPAYNLPTGGKLLAFDIELTGELVIGAGTAGSFLNEAGFANLIQSINVNATSNSSGYSGGDYVSVLPAWAVLRRMQIMQNNGLWRSEMPGWGSAESPAAGTYFLQIFLTIIFADPNMSRKYDFAMNADAVASYTVQVVASGANGSGVVSGNTTAWDTNGLTLQYGDRRIFGAGDTFETYMEFHNWIVQGAAIAQADTQMPKDQDCMFKDILIAAWNGAQSTPQTPSNTVLQQVQFPGDATKVLDYWRFAPEIQADAYRDGFLSPAGTMNIGFFPIIFPVEGWPSEMPNCGTFQNRFWYFNPTGPGNDMLGITTDRCRLAQGAVLVSQLAEQQKIALALKAAKAAN
jgi:hypothetical protein